MEQTPEPQSLKPVRYSSLAEGIAQLPPYARSLLKIRVPLTVTLAETRIPVSQIVELAPGSIIQFKKSCDAPLALEIRGQEIAQGEAIKVGDKFGLQVQSISLPEERFWVIHGQRSHHRAK